MTDLIKDCVLVIEDDEMLRDTIVSFLDIEGITSQSVENGHIGIQKCNNQKFSAIICDINMPVMSGEDTIKYLKQSKFNSNTPIIVLSGALDKNIIVRLGKTITKAFTKPANMEEIVKFVKNYVREG